MRFNWSTETWEPDEDEQAEMSDSPSFGAAIVITIVLTVAAWAIGTVLRAFTHSG